MIKYLLIVILVVFYASCVKDSSYSFPTTVAQELQSVKVTFAHDSMPADGSSVDTLTISFLPTDFSDSTAIASLNLMVSTTSGTFVTPVTTGGSGSGGSGSNGAGGSGGSGGSGGAAASATTVSLTPAYTIDTATKKRQLTAQALLTSPSSLAPAHLRISFLQAVIYDTVTYYRVYPTKLKLTTSSFYIAPVFNLGDTIYAKISGSPSGTPTAGDSITLRVFDSTYLNPLGLFRIANTQSDATGSAFFIFVLGDSVINQVNYYGTVNLIGTAANGTAKPVRDTLSIYSR